MARDAPGWSSLLSMGGVAALLLVAGLAVGWLADSALKTFPIFIFVGLALGIAGACRYMFAEFRRNLKE